jgi:tetratricopeptide (TPR) repeat protein
MEKYVTNIKDLVIQALTNSSEIKAKAESGDALSCFQMGMIHLLGIETPIDFKKAGKYLRTQSLSDYPDANRLLGFIAECEGNYSQAFKSYANAGKANRPYINKVSEERVNLQSLFRRLKLPSTAENMEITKALNEYIKGGGKKVDASIKLAMICEDANSCLDAAQTLFDVGDFYSAMRWLQNGGISDSNTLYTSVKKKISDSKSALNLPKSLEIIEIDGNSFLANFDATPSYVGIKNLCDEAAVVCMKEWYDSIPPKIVSVKKKVEDEEAARIKKQKDEEAARLKKLKAEEDARIRKQEEDEYIALLEAQEIRRNKILRKYNIIFSILFSPIAFLLLIAVFAVKENTIIVNLFACSLLFIIMVCLPYVIIKWIVKKVCKL